MPQGPLVGAITKLFGGSAVGLLAAGKQGDGLVSQLHGEKYSSAYNGKLYSAANSAGVTTSAALATTYVGLCVSNPASSGINMALRRVAGAFIVAPAALTGINLITGYAAGGITTHTTPLTVRSGLIGTGAAGSGLADSACTLVGTPAYSMVLAETPGATSVTNFFTDLQGAILLPPGAYAAIGTTIAGPSSGFMGSIEWEEFPV